MFNLFSSLQRRHPIIYRVFSIRRLAVAALAAREDPSKAVTHGKVAVVAVGRVAETPSHRRWGEALVTGSSRARRLE